MSVLLGCRGLAKSYAHRPLFADLTLSLQEGERIGLIGPNGAGKSTLLRILTGLDAPDEGEVTLQKGLRLAYVPQEEAFAPGPSVLEVARAALADLPAGDLDPETRARIVLGRAGFEDVDQEAARLSGGWRKRLALASALAREPDVLLLDEPTNHLDLPGILWLEELLASAPFASLFVSHDRTFLERVANRVVELGRHLPGGHLRVVGGYRAFVEKRAELLEAQQHQERALANTMRRELEWLRRGPRGRGTKKKDRIEAAHETMRELVEVRARNAAGGAAEIDFSGTGRRSRDLLVAKGLRKQLGERLLFSELDLALGPGDRLGLVGDNGSGKSTLLAVLAGEQEPDAGEVKPARGARVVVFHQDRASLDPEAVLRDVLCPEGDTVHYQGRKLHVSAWAQQFQFLPEQLSTKVGALSGGERARLLIAHLVRQPADLLLLDEPTNDLDLVTREVLEQSLLEFAGAVVLVTHDRTMIERVSTSILGLDGQGGAHSVADLDQWLRARARVERERAEAARPAPRAQEPAPSAPPRRRKRTNNERREFEAMEDTIAAAEAEVIRLRGAAESPEALADHRRLQEMYAELAAAEQRVEALYARWEELEALEA